MTSKRWFVGCWLLALLGGCSNGDTGPLADLVVIEDRDVQGVTVTSNKDIIGVGEVFTLMAADSVSGADLADELVWRSSDESVATVAGGGVVTGVADGTVVISATIGPFEDSFTLTVSSAGLVGIEISSTPPVDVCTSAQLTATGTFADGRTDDITSTVTWQSSDPTLASFDASTIGQLNTTAVGTVDATASQSGVDSAILPVVIADTLTAITLTATASTIGIGGTTQLRALGNYGGTNRDINAAVSFGSATPTVATVDAAGLVTGVAEGTSVLSANCTSQTGETTITVSASTATLVDLEVVGTSPFSVALGSTLELNVEAEFSDFTTLQVTEDASWSVINGFNAAVSVSNLAGTKGVVTPLSLGTATVSAVYQSEEVLIIVNVTATN